jgi:hypothetical protein
MPRRKKEPRDKVLARVRRFRAQKREVLRRKETIFRNLLGRFYRQNKLRRAHWVPLSDFLNSPEASVFGGRAYEEAFWDIHNIEFRALLSKSGDVTKFIRPLWL